MESTSSIGELKTQKTVEQLAVELAELDPKPVDHFTPDNLEEVMEDFLSGKRRNPDNATYSKLDSLDFDELATKYRQILDEIHAHPEIPEKHHHIYESYISRSLDISELMRQAKIYRTAASPAEKENAKKEFERLNKNLYGEIEPEIASAMVKELISDTATVQDSMISQIRQEFMDFLPDEIVGTEIRGDKLEPSEEAKKTIDRAVQFMYGPLLSHANRLMDVLAHEEGKPIDKLRVNPQALAVIFQTIIDSEFPSSGWKTVVDQANAIYVDTATKTLKVPESRAAASPAKVRGLVVHEMGVHMLRSIIGEKADLIPLRFGLSGAGDAEEGIAKVMESVVTDDASRTGYQHYLTAALLARGSDFRDTFETMWRYKVLDAYLERSKSEVNEEFIEKQKQTAFKFMFRSIRGTNRLPWHTTLSYFNGTHKIWEYVEKHKGDPDFITIMFMGKIDPTNEAHLYGAFDAKARAEA